MKGEQWSREDLDQIRDHGLKIETVEDQIAVFKKGAPYANLDRPCTVGDGIKRLGDQELGAYVHACDQAAVSRQMIKFVPASGAATRMFKALLKVAGENESVDFEAVCRQAREHGGEYDEACRFMQKIDHFAFYRHLAETMKAGGLDISRLRRENDFTQTFRYLLTEKGLDYAATPKGLILFHRCPNSPRTAFEEHLVEAAAYVKDKDGKCRLHFTVSAEHQNDFEKLLKSKASEYEHEYGAGFDVGFSQQSPATDTIAVDMENNAFRDSEGRLVFRPGGHGALIRNLNDLGADLIFIKNIDNVVPDRLKKDTYLWKKVLGGYLVKLEKKINSYYKQLAGGEVGQHDLEQIADFVEDQLGVRLPDFFRQAPAGRRKQYLADRLNRPLRVCGMVPSTGEPGGGPFWVRDEQGGHSVQIVESAQIDPDSAEQQKIAKSLTHFNPVDIVASVRDAGGSQFDLHRFADDRAVFISVKSKDGRDLKALEHPGLWNGAMAEWNTVFVEVPLITFNPVKTVNDLLRNEHQG